MYCARNCPCTVLCCGGDWRKQEAERSGCKRERAGSTSMEASSFCSCSCSCPSVRVKRGVTRCWRTLHPTVDCRLQGLAGLQALDGGAQPHPPAWAIPAPHSTTAHHSDHFRAVPRDCGVFLLVPADSAGWGLPPQATGTGCSKLCYRLGW